MDGTAKDPEAPPTIEKVNLAEAFARFEDRWRPRIVGELNGSYVKLVKVEGEFVWHHHQSEDELFLVIKGRLLIRLRDRDLWLEPGEFAIIPAGIEHQPFAEGEAQVLLLEPKSALNTGNVRGERTVEDLERLR